MDKDGFSIDFETEGFRQWTEAVIHELQREDAKLFLRKTALEFCKRVIEKTPVDTGRARAGWHALLVDEGLPPQIHGTNVRQEAVAEGLAEGTWREGGFFGADQFIEIINGVDYIIDLEYGRSDQAPAGMMRVTFAELKQQGTMSKEMGEQLRKTYTQINRRMRSQKRGKKGFGIRAIG